MVRPSDNHTMCSGFSTRAHRQRHGDSTISWDWASGSLPDAFHPLTEPRDLAKRDFLVACRLATVDPLNSASYCDSEVPDPRLGMAPFIDIRRRASPIAGARETDGYDLQARLAAISRTGGGISGHHLGYGPRWGRCRCSRCTEVRPLPVTAMVCCASRHKTTAPDRPQVAAAEVRRGLTANYFAV